MVTKTDFSDDPRFKGACHCRIHTDVSFAIDDECPVCIENEDDDQFVDYINYITSLENKVCELMSKCNG